MASPATTLAARPRSRSLAAAMAAEVSLSSWPSTRAAPAGESSSVPTPQAGSNRVAPSALTSRTISAATSSRVIDNCREWASR